MSDITMYNDSELADNFDNDESLYQIACAATSFAPLQEAADDAFTYTADQLAELKSDFLEGRYDCDLGE